MRMCGKVPGFFVRLRLALSCQVQKKLFLCLFVFCLLAILCVVLPPELSISSCLPNRAITCFFTICLSSYLHILVLQLLLLLHGLCKPLRSPYLLLYPPHLLDSVTTLKFTSCPSLNLPRPFPMIVCPSSLPSNGLTLASTSLPPSLVALKASKAPSKVPAAKAKPIPTSAQLGLPLPSAERRSIPSSLVIWTSFCADPTIT